MQASHLTAGERHHRALRVVRPEQLVELRRREEPVLVEEVQRLGGSGGKGSNDYTGGQGGAAAPTTLTAGLQLSLAGSPAVTRLRRTSGVRPTVS